MTEPSALRFSFQVIEPVGLPRAGEPVRAGLPLPRGAVPDEARLKLEDDAGRALPFQSRALSRWPDNSVKWLLLDTLLDIGAYEKRRLKVSIGEHEGNSPKLVVTEALDAINVETGVASFRVPRSGDDVIGTVLLVGDKTPVASRMRVVFRDGRGRRRHASIRSAKIEESGSLRATILLEGVIPHTSRRHPLEFRVRLVFTACSGVLEAEFRVRNPRRARHRGGLWDLGDPGSQLIRELALVLETTQAPDRLSWWETPDHSARTSDPNLGWRIYQDSSGGESWQSPNHLCADGELSVRFRGYEVRDGEGALIAAGSRATPCLELAVQGSAIACGTDGFWQNFPKAIRVEKNSLQVSLFPAEARCPAELQGGEQKRHRFWLAFGPPGQAARDVARRQRPLQIALDPAEMESSHALYGFAAPKPEDDPRYFSYMMTIIKGEHSFFAGREVIDEYGWRNFGDVYADHEAVNHRGSEPFISHYNNQYDVVLGLLFQGLRTQEPRWWELARDLVHHVVDIDIYHCNHDKPAYNGGLFWHSDHHLPAGLATHRTYSGLNAKGSYGGGPDNEHNYTSGLLLWHFLTGDPEAAEAVTTLANFVIAMDDGSKTVLGLVDKGPTGNASKTISMDYHGPGRGPGNSVNALMDGFRLTGTRCFLDKAEQLIRRCIHPEDDIPRLGLDLPEERWSYLVFLQVLGKYLVLKEELAETGFDYEYARHSLLHYANWMLENERPYNEQLDKVLLPTETWPAQDVRKARVFSVAAAHCTDTVQSNRLRTAAARYADRCLSDLLAFPTAHLVRPRVLLAVNGCEAAKSAVRSPAAVPAEGFGPPSEFIAQRKRVMARLRRLGRRV